MTPIVATSPERPTTPDAPKPEDAEEERIDESLEETFPASDPPAHTPA